MIFALAAIDPWFVRLNVIEGCVWIAIALGMVLASNRQRIDVVLIIALITFGISDFVETRTGGWYKPWWMFLWKTIGVLTIVPAVYVKVRRSKKSSELDQE